MSVEEVEWCWLNGEILPLADARVSVEDRGFQFADGVYEAMRLYDGEPFALQLHLDRLEDSCRGMRLTLPIARDALAQEMMKLVKHSRVRDGLLYLQLTRGQAPRNHLYQLEASPTLLFYARKLPPVVPIDEQPGAKLRPVLDERWRKCWIKAIGLTANILARNDAEAHDCDEAAFVDEHGVVSECTSSNLFFVIDGKLVTHPSGHRVLPGVTRLVVIELARRNGIEVHERPLHVDEATRADEIFITSTTRQILWVSRWDGKTVGEKPGAITWRLAKALDEVIANPTDPFV